ncbi:murein hydrolase activator EnvC family protein [Microbacterium hibisci]|uniref:murein hydrolase activator EnvC family protein n=1 Tax=Microbacterium hibisci TaxID=2036000 RepID=UPI001945157A|nr:M23 family metallopeptidase [Microbacterium hibisci]
MRTAGTDPRRSAGRLIGAVLATFAVAALPGAGIASAGAVPADVAGVAGGPVAVASGWTWPVRPFRLEQVFVAPAHEYGPGHRGVDLRPLSETVVRAPAGGVVAFSGEVAGRGVLTLDHGSGLVTTLEPVDSDLATGTPVAAGEPVGSIALGGHTAPGALHFGVRLDGEYINPLVLLGGVPRAVLLPCC